MGIGRSASASGIGIGHRSIARQQADQWRAIAIATIGPINWPYLYPVANLLT